MEWAGLGSAVRGGLWLPELEAASRQPGSDNFGVMKNIKEHSEKSAATRESPRSISDVTVNESWCIILDQQGNNFNNLQ